MIKNGSPKSRASVPLRCRPLPVRRWQAGKNQFDFRRRPNNFLVLERMPLLAAAYALEPHVKAISKVQYVPRSLIYVPSGSWELYLKKKKNEGDCAPICEECTHVIITFAGLHETVTGNWRFMKTAGFRSVQSMMIAQLGLVDICHAALLRVSCANVNDRGR
jgi:hypothetical protein